jgi:hypothetical protein
MSEQGRPTSAWDSLTPDEREVRLARITRGAELNYGMARWALSGIQLLEGLPYGVAVIPVAKLRKMANGLDLSVERMVELASDPRAEVRRVIAEHPLTPQDVVVQLLEDEDDWVRTGAAGNPHLPAEILSSLAFSGDAAIRFGVAYNPASSVVTLTNLLAHDDVQAKQRIAWNGLVPISILEKLAALNDGSINWGLARNPCIPLDIAEAIAASGREDARKQLALNVCAPVQVLEQLAKDQDAGIRTDVEANPATPAEVIALLPKGFRYQYTCKSHHRYIVQVPEDFEAEDFNMFYITELLYSSEGEILDSLPDVTTSGPMYVEDPERIAPYLDSHEPGTMIKAIDETVWSTFRFQSTQAMTLEQFHEALTWTDREDLDVDDDVEVLERIVLNDELTWEQISAGSGVG